MLVVVNQLSIDESLTTSCETIFSRIQKWIVGGSGWITESIDGKYINNSIHDPVEGRSCIKFSLELRNSRKGSINVQNKDNEYFCWCHI